MKARIENIGDLTAVGARYHRFCLSDVKRAMVKDTRGRPISDKVDCAMQYIYNYIEENSDE